jgi:hypothetical protein
MFVWKGKPKKHWCLHYEKYGNLRLALQLGVSCNDHSTYFYNMNVGRWVAWVAIDQSLYVELHMYAIVQFNSIVHEQLLHNSTTINLQLPL